MSRARNNSLQRNLHRLIRNAEDVIEAGLEHLLLRERAVSRPLPSDVNGKSLVEICAMVRGLTEDLDFSRNPSTDRPIGLV